MKKQDLLKLIAQKGYTIGYAANLNFATYDIVNKAPKWITFTSIVVSILGLAWAVFTAKVISVLFLIMNIASVCINCYTKDIKSYENRGKKNTDQQNGLKILYHVVKGMDETADFTKQESEYAAIEKEFNDDSQPNQIAFAHCFAHYKFFFEKDCSWMDEQLHFGWWKDKTPQKVKICVYLLVCCLFIYYCYKVPRLNSFFKMIFFVE